MPPLIVKTPTHEHSSCDESMTSSRASTLSTVEQGTCSRCAIGQAVNRSHRNTRIAAVVAAEGRRGW